MLDWFEQAAVQTTQFDVVNITHVRRRWFQCHRSGYTSKSKSLPSAIRAETRPRFPHYSYRRPPEHGDSNAGGLGNWQLAASTLSPCCTGYGLIYKPVMCCLAIGAFATGAARTVLTARCERYQLSLAGFRRRPVVLVTTLEKSGGKLEMMEDVRI